jgi:hypothetical protein
MKKVSIAAPMYTNKARNVQSNFKKGGSVGCKPSMKKMGKKK